MPLTKEIFGDAPLPRIVQHADYLDRQGTVVDDVLFTVFAGPNSYTGEDSLEISCHGNPFIAQRILEDLFGRGCRPAGPGEFTQRAFLNDKLDLAQAEAIADLIDAGSREAVRAAMRSLQGEFSAMVRGLTEAVIDLRTYVEAAIDFPEEEIDFLADRELLERFQAVREHL